jgi:septum site-determining protein MinC
VIDLGPMDLAGKEFDWPALINLFKSYRLNVVAVRNAPPEMESTIVGYGLSLDIVVKPRRPAAEEELVAEIVVAPAPPVIAPAPVIVAPPIARNAMIIDTPVRAGQRIYARDTDLIVTACVNNGAEIIADGNIHVYAPLRGRALAGASGNADVRIFALSMEAELLSIAGYYRNFEDGLPTEFAGRPSEVRLNAGRIEMSSMQAASKT